LFGYKIDGGKFYKHVYIFLSLFNMHALSCSNYINSLVNICRR